VELKKSVPKLKPTVVKLNLIQLLLNLYWCCKCHAHFRNMCGCHAGIVDGN